MRRLLHGLTHLNRGLERCLHWLLLALLFGFIALIVYQIVSRNLPLMPRLYWTEEFSRFAFQWMIMLGTAIGVLHADHFVLEAFPRGSRASLVTRWIRDLSCLAVGLIFVIHGKDFALSGLRREATASGLSMIYVYSAFSVSGLLIILFSAQRLLHALLDGVPRMEASLDTPDAVEEALEAHAGHGDELDPSLSSTDGRTP
ncbi:TRAP transporter small permease [Halomonas elongata]|uniref:TRAP transporter small permease protein n=1 Tax=Halomonas elongata (strain ATCC 33173 / DSM 2581 / NBRC 15536 / NCIMB 2198 / 1H9) TaxID=768066 RepID=E1V502_HALED|nr:TRAP transporter small permease subunit [Halomonas elongata]WBF18289.1 TRAP transporter small permease subunit [Halomonas elongata]WPU47141.1 TRAP transporter small permease subunit [Halomonas elongata DSM 2581]CBV41051.1 TRAP transporter small transmembrane protein (probable substrate D-mannuronate) [Halomonas elongata DSM 2581]